MTIASYRGSGIVTYAGVWVYTEIPGKGGSAFVSIA